MRIVIELKKDVYPQVILNYLYKHTQMQETFGANMLALVDGKPRILNLREMIYYYLEHQKGRGHPAHPLRPGQGPGPGAHLGGLLKALDHIDEIVQIIRSSENPNAAKTALIERFQFSDKQAQAILDMRLARLTGPGAGEAHGGIPAAGKRPSPSLPPSWPTSACSMNVIKTEITAIRDKFADERRTELTTLEGEIDVADLIQEEDMVVTLTHAGYVKRIAKSTYGRSTGAARASWP